jgi:hypothetical protein
MDSLAALSMNGDILLEALGRDSETKFNPNATEFEPGEMAIT